MAWSQKNRTTAEVRALQVQATMRWRAKHPERHRKTWRNQAFKRAYGLSLMAVESMMEAQNYRCAACDSPVVFDGRSNDSACVDHNHVTGAIRGILCRNCNNALGHLKDDPVRIDRLAAYIRKANARQNE